ncbi:hypothetical protein F2P81_017636 [Scophthalmus maximus]|uniref:Uncharacterized protein n=1 Tax=Scophthalmus maximus TaxID=52904 RepID=A0A6A4SEE7_SCOMX|nr:hypothetical protein F2P81_017636 [Scophthalmus maximus]
MKPPRGRDDEILVQHRGAVWGRVCNADDRPTSPASVNFRSQISLSHGLWALTAHGSGTITSSVHPDQDNILDTKSQAEVLISVVILTTDPAPRNEEDYHF